MTELDDEIERELRLKKDKAPRDRLFAKYGGGSMPLPLTGLSPLILEFCSRLTMIDGESARSIEFEGMTLVSQTWAPRSYFARVDWPKESKQRYDYWQRDSRPARLLRLEGNEESWEFIAKTGGPWAPTDGRDASAWNWDLNWGLKSAMVSYLAERSR